MNYTLAEGTPILAVIRTTMGNLHVEQKFMKHSQVYFMKDIVIDPDLGSSNEHENHFASRGFFGFKLPKNSKGYDMIICHISNMTVTN